MKTTTIGELATKAHDLGEAIKERTFRIIMARGDIAQLEDDQAADKAALKKLEKKLAEALNAAAREGGQ